MATEIFTDHQLSIITTIGTLGATLVALFIVIIPALWRKLKISNLAWLRCKNELWIIHELIRGYFFYNPTRMILEPGEISYSFDLTNISFAIKIDYTEILRSLYSNAVELDSKTSRELTELLNRIELILSGIPQHHSFWTESDEKIENFRKRVFKDSQTSVRKSVATLYKESLEFDK